MAMCKWVLGNLAFGVAAGMFFGFLHTIGWWF
jgi:hypothetical protein